MVLPSDFSNPFSIAGINCGAAWVKDRGDTCLSPAIQNLSCGACHHPSPQDKGPVTGCPLCSFPGYSMIRSHNEGPNRSKSIVDLVR